jgi:hypothetical protein
MTNQPVPHDPERWHAGDPEIGEVGTLGHECGLAKSFGLEERYGPTAIRRHADPVDRKGGRRSCVIRLSPARSRDPAGSTRRIEEVKENAATRSKRIQAKHISALGPASATQRSNSHRWNAIPHSRQTDRRTVWPGLSTHPVHDLNGQGQEKQHGDKTRSLTHWCSIVLVLFIARSASHGRACGSSNSQQLSPHTQQSPEQQKQLIRTPPTH